MTRGQNVNLCRENSHTHFLTNPLGGWNAFNLLLKLLRLCVKMHNSVTDRKVNQQWQLDLHLNSALGLPLTSQ